VLYIKGQLPTSSIKSPRAPFADPTKVPFNTNLVKIVGRAYAQPGSGMDNAQTAVLIVAPNFNASLIGAGPTGAPLQPEFGTKDLKVYNIDFENAAVILLSCRLPMPRLIVLYRQIMRSLKHS